MIVYKYFPPKDYIFDSLLEKSRIRFSQPEIYNDPFESFPSFANDKKEKIEFAKTKYRKTAGTDIPPESLQIALKPFYDELDSIPALLGESIVSLCLTQRKCNGLMWAHYADSHRGLAIGLDAESSFFKPGNGRSKHGLRKVNYSKIRPTASSTGVIFNIESEQETYFFTKSIDWKYEEEWRICASTQFAIPSEPKDDEKMYLFKFPPDCLRELIFGFRMTEDNRSKIVAIMSARYPDTKLFEANLNETSFDLDIDPYHV